MCETPQILRAVGLNDLPMLMTQKHVRNINKGADGSRKHYHGISRDVIKKIPQYLQEPVAIMDSLSTATQPGVVVLTEEVDSEGRPIVIAIKPDGQGFYDVDLDSNFILSMYGRNNFEKFLEDNVKESTFLYISNKKSKALFEKVRRHRRSPSKALLLMLLYAKATILSMMLKGKNIPCLWKIMFDSP